MLIFVLDEVNSFDDIRMMQGRRYTEFGSEFLDIFSLCFALPPLSEFLEDMYQKKRRDQINQPRVSTLMA